MVCNFPPIFAPHVTFINRFSISITRHSPSINIFNFLFFSLIIWSQLCFPIHNNIYIADTVVFSFTGNVSTFVVPDGVEIIKIDAYGAQGGQSTRCLGTAGRGGYISANVDVTPGETLYIRVAGQGQVSAWTAGGYNGGGGCLVMKDAWASGGGGATDIRRVSSDILSALVVAGKCSMRWMSVIVMRIVLEFFDNALNVFLDNIIFVWFLIFLLLDTFHVSGCNKKHVIYGIGGGGGCGADYSNGGGGGGDIAEDGIDFVEDDTYANNAYQSPFYYNSGRDTATIYPAGGGGTQTAGGAASPQGGEPGQQGIGGNG